MHRDPQAWTEPERFQPERWLQDASPTAASGSANGSRSAGSSYAAVLSGMGPNGSYVPFGAGQRNCIGTGFAWMEAIIVLAAILQRYEMSPAAPGAAFPRPAPLLTLRPEAVRLKLVPRVLPLV